jgi:hypothetical protein
MVALIPTLRPRQSNWTLLGLGLAGVLQGPMSIDLRDGTTLILLPWILCGHLLAAWMIAGGPARREIAAPHVQRPVAADDQVEGSGTLRS